MEIILQNYLIVIHLSLPQLSSTKQVSFVPYLQLYSQNLYQCLAHIFSWACTISQPLDFTLLTYNIDLNKNNEELN